MLQAAVLDCVFFDFFPFSENSFIASEVDVRRRDVAECLAPNFRAPNLGFL